MAQKVTAMDVRMAAAAAGGVPNVAEFCRAHGISRQTFYLWRRRFRAEGLDGLRERSRRPLRSPSQSPSAVEDEVVRLRKELASQGWDNGPDSIRDRLDRDPRWAGAAPSRATVWRILARRGQITPQPQKRPNSSLRRFAHDRPNDCWQSDWTEWHLADGSPAAIAGTLDDHSRYLAALAAGPGDGTGRLVWTTMLAAIGECGVPARSLTDNGLVYNGSRRGRQVAFDTNLRALGVQTIASSPYHPQTCGKIERFWQTLKKWLDAHDPSRTVAELNDRLAEFRAHYNHDRPHRALRGATPATAFAATAKARPADRPVPAATTARTLLVRGNGCVDVNGGHQVGVGRQWLRQAVTVLQDGDFVAVFAGDHLIRALTIDTTRDYQPLGRPAKARNELNP